MYNCVLLPTDGSAEMEPVVDHAAALADRDDASIHALYVVDAASFSSLPMETSWEGISELLYEEGTAALNEVERIVGGRAPVERIVAEGKPSKTIVEHADDDGCDLIVMGTHGRGGIDRLLLGSVAERVVRRSPVPVMTVRVEEPAVVDREPEMKA
ncbi:Nucleotide-binding universal stress protein, UspA family [Halorientalis persicus]|jgi:nucleotide-binding universal stress UspA family protein|uniref:Nucleotide-binding universal stress protein, UspA family n=1 Tax=Halorientalis persicus TaxID=1367881 RepID=A0A1H8JK59_9EURY|nr:universal stress protein [Halorientalis persicus]SEN80647.1 Nucleotide-binding universal stress protein, UspA family [Halorientalis persicus]